MKSAFWGSLSWWPTLLGIALAGFIAPGMASSSELAPILAASGLVYLGAGALRKPSAAWPLFFLTFVVITAARIGIANFDATWVFLGIAVLFLGYGLLRGTAGGLPLSTNASTGMRGRTRAPTDGSSRNGGAISRST